MAKRYSLTATNRNGYSINLKGNNINNLKSNFKRFYPMQSFFIYIYDIKNDCMICQNNYGNKFFKCNNNTFIPYYC